MWIALRQLPATVIAGLFCLSSQAARAAEFHPIASVTSSTSNDLWPVSNLIQGPGEGFAAGEPHDQLGSGASHRWVTAAPGGFPSDYIEETGKPVLLFDLGEDRALSEISCWGYTTTNANGVSAFRLRFATAAEGTAGLGSSIEYQPTFRPEIDDQARQRFAFGELVVARYVEFTCEDNFYANGGNGPPGGGDRVGFGEIAFADEVPNPNPVLSLGAASIDFGNEPTYSGPSTRVLTVTNLGGVEDLEITAADIVPADPESDAFSWQNTDFPMSVAAGESAELELVFDPGANEGCFHAMVDLRSNDPARPTVTVLLSGGINCTPVEPAEPEFSVESGTFIESFDLVLSTPTPGAHIVYTTDGSEPSLDNGTLYTGPVRISGSLPFRAATVTADGQTAVASERYIFLAEDIRSYVSGLPIVIVDNFGAGPIPDKGWSTATQTGVGLIQQPRQAAGLLVMNRDPASGMASVVNAAETDSRIGIRVRGAFSSTWDPKPYSFESWKKDADVDRNIAPLGMPSDSDWILYHPHPSYDRTMLYNTFIWELSRETGRYGTRFRFVDVFVNEDGGDLRMADRRGIYALAEKVKRGNDRIDFAALSEDGSTGGWLLGINRMDPEPAGGFPAENGATSPQFFHTAGPNRVQQTPPNAPGQGDDIPRQYNAFINFENPNGYAINAQQRAAIENWFREFEDVFYDDALWLDPQGGYRHYVNTRDFIDYFHLLNLAKQGDGLLLSVFPWVSSGDRKLHMGPMWDFNNGAYGSNTNSPLYFRRDRLWYPRLFEDPTFQREYEDRWYALRRGPLSDGKMDAIIDRQSAAIPQALVSAEGLSASAWSSRLATMKNNLKSRAAWLDAQFFRPPDFNHPGGLIGPTFGLEISNHTGTPGTIYYTTDGSDPMPASGVTAVETVLLDQGAHASALIPSLSNGGSLLAAADWTGIADPPNAAHWMAGTTGVGYDYDGLTGLDVSSMVNANGSVFVRIPFTVADQETLDAWSGLVLRMKYDDGFTAWINGTPVATDRAPAEPAWNSLATASHFDPDAMEFVEFDISPHLELLQAGENMLAIQGMNASLGSSDLLVLPQLAARRLPGYTAQVYTGPIPFFGSATVRARIQSHADGSWSALNEGTFILGTPAHAKNLAISEIMYHPADAEAGGEFIEVQNIDPVQTVDLTLAQFTEGIRYLFPVGATLAPGERLVVSQEEFLEGTRLSNGGERLVLTGAEGSVIRSFRYDDDAPWPEAADGGGFSLVLVDPMSNPDHADPANWRRSASPGGRPGGTDAVRFAGDPDIDRDGDGLSALVEHALGGSDEDASDAANAMTISVDAADQFALTFARNAGADDVAVTIETSTDLHSWRPATEATLAGLAQAPSGEVRELWLVPPPATEDEPAGFFRLRAIQR